MARKLKMTLSLDPDLVEMVETISRRTKKPRSRVVQDALRSWQRQELQEKLAQGYRSMAEEDQATAEGGLAAFRETLE